MSVDYFTYFVIGVVLCTDIVIKKYAKESNVSYCIESELVSGLFPSGLNLISV